MIRFSCPGCRRVFTVEDKLAGRSAKCKHCGAAITVPTPELQTASTAAEPSPALTSPVASATASDAKLPVRTRRLMADSEQMYRRFASSPMIRLISAKGDPAELYQVQYNVRSIERMEAKKPIFRDQHIAEIQLVREYPRLSPKCKLITPIFHPNIDETTICVGDHWAAGERLTDLVIRIGEMLAYQAYNIKSPLNGEAAMWADLNPTELPTDPRSLHEGEAD